MRVVAFLPKAHRETRGCAAILPACAAIQSIGGKMKVRVVVSLLGVLALFGGVARAQERQTVEVFAGYSYLRANPATSGINGFSLNGGSASVSYNVNNWLSGVADLGGYHSGDILGSGVDGTLSTYLFGPRVSYRHLGRVTPFGEVLFGVARAGSSVFATTDS